MALHRYVCPQCKAQGHALEARGFARVVSLGQFRRQLAMARQISDARGVTEAGAVGLFQRPYDRARISDIGLVTAQRIEQVEPGRD